MDKPRLFYPTLPAPNAPYHQSLCYLAGVEERSKTLGESKRGRHNQSVEPFLLTKATEECLKNFSGCDAIVTWYKRLVMAL